MTNADDLFVEAINHQCLAELADRLVTDPDDEVRALALRCRSACRHIAERVAAERSEVVELLSAAGLAVDVDERPTSMQHHTTTLRVADAESAARAAAVLTRQGFEPWERWTAGAERSFRHHAPARTVARSTDVTIVVKLRWADAATRSLRQRLFTPTAADWQAVRLPAALWRGYAIVRPIRLVAERLGVKERYESGLGPFLATPDELIDPLLDAAGVGAGDLVVDLGCGDGRLVMRAAARGARARGIENDPALVDRARAAVDVNGLDDVVEIVAGDARFVDLSDATVALAFLPIDVAATLLPGLLERLAPGAILLVHEQHPLPAGLRPRPDVSIPVVGDRSITVAHRWNATGPR